LTDEQLRPLFLVGKCIMRIVVPSSHFFPVGETQEVRRCQSWHPPVNHFLGLLSEESPCLSDSDCLFATLSISLQSQTEICSWFWSRSLFKQRSNRRVWMNT
jgi:hypothetical protein